jgi:hypothetical protein
MGKNLIFNFFLHFSVFTKKLLDTKVILFFLNLGSIFLGVKNCFSLGLAVLLLE